MAIISGLALHPVTTVSTSIYFMLFSPEWQKNYQRGSGFLNGLEYGNKYDFTTGFPLVRLRVFAS